MKFHFKGFLAGLLSGLAIVSTVAATPVGTTLENVVIDGIRIVIDGKEFTCTDANGEVVKPMRYNGTTYIPVRAVSTAFGKAVYWDGEEETVYLGKMDGKLKEPTAKLTDLKNIAGNNYVTAKNIFDNYDNFYNSAIYCGSFWTYYRNDSCQVLLDGKYSKFKATLFVERGSNWDEATKDFITVIGDEKTLFKSEELGKTSKSVDIEVDVSGVNDFKIIFNNNDGLRIANAGFYQ